MKPIFMTIVVLLVCSWAYSQKFSYEYDEGGNRIKRIVITLKNAQEASAENHDPVIDSWAQKEVKIYPNPTQSNLSLYITEDDFESTYFYKVYNAQGKQVINGKFESSEECTIPMNSLNAGTYLLVITNKKESKSYKIIKQ